MAEITQSILLTTKKMLGISEEYHAFDLDIIININSIFLGLNQLGIGPRTPFQITGVDEVWTDFVDPTTVPGIQTYIYLKTRLLFDPPTNSFLVDNIQKQIAELEWRMNVQVETPPIIDENSEESEEPGIEEPPIIDENPEEPEEPGTEPTPTPEESKQNLSQAIKTTVKIPTTNQLSTSKLSTNQILINRLKQIRQGVISE